MARGQRHDFTRIKGKLKTCYFLLFLYCCPDPWTSLTILFNSQYWSLYVSNTATLYVNATRRHSPTYYFVWSERKNEMPILYISHAPNTCRRPHIRQYRCPSQLESTEKWKRSNYCFRAFSYSIVCSFKGVMKTNHVCFIRKILFFFSTPSTFPAETMLNSLGNYSI